jgi:hypothetical protein
MTPTAGSSAAIETPRTPRTPATAHSSQFTLVTHETIDASADRVWDSLHFYEELATPPPLLLRLVLPSPIPTTAGAMGLGQEKTLFYEGGHYARRVVRLEPPHSYEFDVVEQRLANDRGVRLLGGSFALRRVGADHTDLSITTVYSSRLRPRWLFQGLESIVCRRLQRHLLAAIAHRAGQN